MGEPDHRVHIPARQGRGVRLKTGESLVIVDVEGHQVADLVAFCAEDPEEQMSTGHTVSCNASIALRPGDQLFSTRRNPLLTIVADDVGRHDIVVPCCDPERYARDYGLPDHRSCLDNLRQARDLLGVDVPIRGENAWNVFMRNRVEPDGSIVTDPASHPPGAAITLRAERDLIVLVSACPQDLTPCNDFNPTSLDLVVTSGATDAR
jgi:uncharacterized protein YcgI (DUF1989 family)